MYKGMRRFRAPAQGATLAVALIGAAVAETAPAPPAVPFVLPHGEKDIALVPSGTYTLDPNHAAVMARYLHLGFSFSMFRFDRVQGTLSWDAAMPSRSKLTASVETDSVATNVAGFAKQIAGDEFLKSAAFPQATFVSTGFRQVDKAHGQVDGQLTLMGKTKPVTFDVTLVGAGKGFAGGPVMGHVIGIHAETSLDPQDYGLPPLMKDPILLTIDTEFGKKP